MKCITSPKASWHVRETGLQVNAQKVHTAVPGVGQMSEQLGWQMNDKS